MADPSSEDEGLLREWAPLTCLLQQIPLKAQRGIFTHELNLTCVDALSDFIAVGTNLGLVYWYNRRKGELQRLRCENTASAVTCVKVISTVDYMVAAGNEQGIVSVFQIPKDPPDSLPESMKPRRKKQVERYTISGLHTSSVTAIEWSLNGMKLFSGDKNGLVVLTEIDFYMHLSKSVELLNEKYEIVQLSYCQQLLLVSTTYRSIVCHRDDRWRVAQVGQKERKSLGKLGATFCIGSGRPQDLTVYASRPGLRLWLADKNGIVQQTLIYKDTMMREHRHVPLINPAPAHMKTSRGDHTFGPLHVFKENLLVTYSQDTVYVLNPADIYVVATVADLRRVQDVSVTKDEIFILEGDRSIIRVAYLPEAILEQGQGSDEESTIEHQNDQLNLNEVFLYIVGCPLIQERLADASEDTDSVWLDVASEMSRLGYPLGENAAKKCEQKWNDMISCYNVFQETKQWDSDSEYKSYFETLDQILKPNVEDESKQSIVEVLPVTAKNESPAVEPKSKKLKLVCDEVYHADSLPSSESQSDEGEVETSETNPPSIVYVDLLNDSDSIYYDDEHITVYPETSNSELAEEVAMPSTDSDSNQNVYIVVTPSLVDPLHSLEDSEEQKHTEAPKDADLVSYAYVPVSRFEQVNVEMEQSNDMSEDTDIVHKPNQSLRPVPTPAQALMTLVTRIGKEERERDNLRRYNIERRFKALEHAIWQQNCEISELTEKATALLSDLLQEDSSERAKLEFQQDLSFMPTPISLTDTSIASSFVDFTSRLKENAIPALPLHKMTLFGKENTEEGTGIQDGWNSVVTADEAIELPPIVALPEGLANLMIERNECENVNGIGSTSDEPKITKEVYNRSRQSSSHSTQEFALMTEASRAEVLEKIGEQKFEEVVFKPKSKKKKNKKGVKSKHFVSGAESGSDTISVNSARSNVSDGEDPWSSERLDMSSDWSGMSTRASSSANECAAKRSSSEETLVRLGDSMISEFGTLPGEEANCCVEQGRRPSDLTVNNQSDLKVSHVPLGIQPDLRSPASIERDVADKERLLAEVLNLDTLCIEKGSKVSGEKQHTSSDGDPVKLSSNTVSSQSCVLSPESSPGVSVEQKQEEICSRDRTNSSELSDDNTESQDEKLASIGSTLSYGPPSGSSAPPSNHASLEIAHPIEIDPAEESIPVSERADNWVEYRTPDSIVGFCVSSHYVCCIDSNSRIHYSGVNGLGLKWLKADDRGEQISLSDDSSIVWKLHKGTAYALVLPSQKGPFGDKWIVAARDVQSIAVDENVAWYVSLDSRVYVQKGLTAENPVSTPVPVCCVLPIVRVSCFESAVWVLTSTDKVLYRENISLEVPEGVSWKEVPVPFPVMDILLGCQGTGWIVDEKNVIHFTKDFTAKQPQWWQILISDYIFQPTTPLQHFCTKLTDNYLKNLRQSSTVILAAGKNAMWISEKMADKIHMNKTEFTGHQWNRIALKNLNPNYKWHRISARGMSRDQGQLWLLSESGDFFSYSPSTGNIYGIPVPDSVVCVSATPQGIWLLSAEGQIYVRQMYTTLPSDSCWRRVNLTQLDNIRFSHISCGNDTVWACNDLGDVYMTIGSPRSMASPTFAPAWIPADEKPECKIVFTKVYVGPHSFMVWALDKKKNIYVRQHVVPDFPLGKGWSLISGIEAVDLTVSESAVWALSAGGSVYRRYGISQANCMGDYWKKIPGSVDFLSATLNDCLWGLDKKSYLLKHSQLPVTLCCEDFDSKLSDPCSSLEGDWEHISVNKI